MLEIVGISKSRRDLRVGSVMYNKQSQSIYDVSLTRQR
jgi:hypothetical protein